MSSPTDSLPPAWDTFCQNETHSCIQNALAFPGTVQQLPHCTLSFLPALATMISEGGSYADPQAILEDSVTAILQGRETDIQEAKNILFDGTQPATDAQIHDLDGADGPSTVFILVTNASTDETLATISGEGINHREPLKVKGLHIDWISAFMHWNREIAKAVDMLLIDREGCIIGLPRTTCIRPV